VKGIKSTERSKRKKQVKEKVVKAM